MKERISQLEEQLKKLNVGYKYLQKRSSYNCFAFKKISKQSKIDEKKMIQQTNGNALNGVFTKTQQLALIPTKRVNWTSKDIVKALSLRSF